jgi:hypothetical protein
MWADARGLRIQVVEHLGDLRHCDEVELATKRDQPLQWVEIAEFLRSSLPFAGARRLLRAS